MFKKFKQYLTSPLARDFIGVSIFGFCSGILYLLLGRSWDYTKFIMEIEEYLHAGIFPETSIFPVLTTTFALISGMAIATILSKSFKFQQSTLRVFATRFLSGGLMGIAIGFIPGGNDTIILHGIPGIAFHAPVALMTMMIAIAVVLAIRKQIKTISIEKPVK